MLEEIPKNNIPDDEDNFNSDYEDDFNSDEECDYNDDKVSSTPKKNSEESSDDDGSSSMEVTMEFGDEDEIDIVIEIDDDDLNDDDDSTPIKTDVVEGNSPESDIFGSEDITKSKHKQYGKHALNYDTIFKGKKETLDEDQEIRDANSMYFNEDFNVDVSLNYYVESQDPESYEREKLVKEKVYQCLLEKTDLNFMNNRRKPSRMDFNNYFWILKTSLETEKFTNIELFNELSYYFSDNLFNMFKLLENRYRNMIISELQNHIGKSNASKEIKNRNIYEGTEIEFLWKDHEGIDKHITGVVLEARWEESMYRVDSYENIYEVKLEQITKILNNSKFKYNLNKLNNIDFL